MVEIPIDNSKTNLKVKVENPESVTAVINGAISRKRS